MIKRATIVIGRDFQLRYMCLNFAQVCSFKQTLGEGTTLYVFMILSGYSSLIFDTSRVPIPEMVRLVFDVSTKKKSQNT